MDGCYTDVDHLDHNPTVVARYSLCKHLLKLLAETNGSLPPGG